MGVRESLLNTITSVADSDFVRIVTAAGASSKATVRNLFKGFESNLSAKSSLTTSDYIRVVGSDNEAYKQLVSDVAKKIIENYTGSSLAGSSQSVKNALDSLNSNSMTVKAVLSNSDNLNDLTNGVYIWTTARPQNIPVSENYGLVMVFEGNLNGTYYNFQLCSLPNRRLYYRRKQGEASGAFAAWSLVTATQV